MKRSALLAILWMAACSLGPPGPTSITLTDHDAGMGNTPADGSSSADGGSGDYLDVNKLPANTKWMALPVHAAATPGSTILATTDEGKSFIGKEQTPGKYCVDVGLKANATTQVTFSAKDANGTTIATSAMESIVQQAPPADTTPPANPPPTSSPSANVAIGGLAYVDGYLGSDTQLTSLNDGNNTTYTSISGFWPDDLWYAVRLKDEQSYQIAKIIVRGLGEPDGASSCLNGPLKIWYTNVANPGAVDNGSLSDSPHGSMNEWTLVPGGNSDGSQAEFTIDLSMSPIDATHIAVTFNTVGCAHVWEHEYYSLSELEAWTASSATVSSPTVSPAPTCANGG